MSISPRALLCAALALTIVCPAGLAQSRASRRAASQILLTTDKPLYQPGQVIHLRALALDQGTRRAVGDKPVTFEVEDARGNKVFKKRETLSRFGVASADFVLADEVNMGNFAL